MVDMDDPASALDALGEVVAAEALERCVFAGNLKGSRAGEDGSGQTRGWR